MRYFKISIYVVILTAGICLLWSVSPEPACAETHPVVRYASGKLTLKAKDVSLISLLRDISGVTGMEVFVDKDINPAKINVDINNKSLENGLKSILKGFNYALIYDKKKDVMKITGLKVYPAGKRSGELIPVQIRQNNKAGIPNHEKETKTVFVSSMNRTRMNGGLLVPAHSAYKSSREQAEQANQPWFQMEKTFERKETVAYEELLYLKAKIESAKDPLKKDALSLVYADRVEKFYSEKRVHINKIEGLKRIYQNRKMTGQ